MGRTGGGVKEEVSAENLEREQGSSGVGPDKMKNQQEGGRR